MTRLGAFLKGAFGRPKPDREAVQRVKEWTRAVLQAAPDTAFAVNEIACTDPSCPGIETIILVMEPGVKTRAYKVAKALDDVTEEDIRVAIAQ
ncbi:hypothetical protein [Microvirga alba]|uniref:Nitrate reductase n=1 Tax=Microvirga alba TaxID=2791025 RepID=A0A931FQK3_9HYPH|nr:hypothetical protein [Microvirga alba]MBF9234727.1 hypothetical protein [Microvirga alba]